MATDDSDKTQLEDADDIPTVVGDQETERVERGQFPMTRWTMVLEARDGTEASAAKALSELCSRYWYPLYAFARRSGNQAHDAEDLTQGFFSDLLARQSLQHVAPEKGKLRTFLLKAFKNFMNNRRVHDRAAKRGGGVEHLSIDQQLAEERYQYEPVDSLTPDVVYERHWTLTLLEHVRHRLQAEYEKRGKGELFDALKSFLQPRSTDTPYIEVAQRFDMSEGAVKATAHRMRERYRVLLEEEISHTVTSQEEISEEIRHLSRVFQ